MVEVFHVAGDTDYLLYVAASDTTAMDDFILEYCAASPVIQHVETSLVFRHLGGTNVLPADWPSCDSKSGAAGPRVVLLVFGPMSLEIPARHRLDSFVASAPEMLVPLCLAADLLEVPADPVPALMTAVLIAIHQKQPVRAQGLVPARTCELTTACFSTVVAKESDGATR